VDEVVQRHHRKVGGGFAEVAERVGEQGPGVDRKKKGKKTAYTFTY
jgi:hypothetical protein